MLLKLDISSTLMHRSTARRRLQLVASSFPQFYRQQHCLYVQVQYLAKADERIILHCCSCAIESREFELCKYLASETAHFRQPPYQVWSAFFHDLAAFTSRHSCKSFSFLVTSLKSSLKIRKSCIFPPKKKNCKQTDCELTSACFILEI